MEIKKEFLPLFKYNHVLHFPHLMYEYPVLHSLQRCLFPLYNGKWLTPLNLVSFVGVPWTATFLDGSGVVTSDGFLALCYAESVKKLAATLAWTFFNGMNFLFRWRILKLRWYENHAFDKAIRSVSAHM